MTKTKVFLFIVYYNSYIDIVRFLEELASYFKCLR